MRNLGSMILIFKLNVPAFRPFLLSKELDASLTKSIGALRKRDPGVQPWHKTQHEFPLSEQQK